MVLHQIGYQELLHEIKRVLDVSTIISVNNHEMLVPVKIGNGKASLFQTIHQTQIINNNGEQIPLAGLVKINHGSGLRSITAGMDGEYFPVWLDIPSDKFSSVTSKIRSLFKKNDRFNLGFSGEIQENNQMIRELLVIITISVLLLYFILAAQFESLVLPLIVLIEIPLDLFGAFLFLQFFNQGINIMSGIGVIVMSGIIVNDSILKIDTINKLSIRGFSLLRSIFEAGKRRLKPILMTSITTILAMVPILFQEGMAAELQYPLALTIIGGMIQGTLVSLIIIPLLYLLIKKRNWVKNQKPPLRKIYHG